MARISVFLNSHASQGSTHFSEDDLKKFFFRHELAIHAPHSLDDLNARLLSEVESGVDYIFSVGGDGTANTISQKLIGKNIKLMVLPAGTANDLATEIGITNNIRKVSEIFNSQTTKKIDAININGRYMMSNGGLGMACEVAKTVNSLRKESPLFKKFMKSLGKETYSLIYAQKMLAKAFKTRRIFIESKHSPLLDPRVTSPLILVNNQEFIGGKFRVAPYTRNDDGKFNVTIFLHKNKVDLLKCTLQMLMGMYPKNDKNLISFETDQLTLNSLDNRPLEFFGDGETFPKSDLLNISLEPKALEVCTYKGESLYCSSHSLSSIEMIQ